MKPAAALMIVPLMLAMTACSPSAEPEPIVSSPALEPSSTPEGPSLNTRGAIDTSLGEQIIVTFPGTDRAGVTLSVDQVDLAVQCTGDFAFPAPSGQWIAVRYTVTTSADYQALSGNQPMRLYGNDFATSIDADGVLSPSNGMSGCIEGDDAVLDIPAGATTNGVLVLDAPPGVTRLVWEPSTFVVEVVAREWVIG